MIECYNNNIILKMLNLGCLLVIMYLSVSGFDLWKKYVPQPVEIKSDSVYDYYDILEELGR